MSDNIQQQESLCQLVLETCLRAGADAAETVLMEGQGIDIQVRNLELEDVNAHEEQALGIRVFVGQRQANLRTTNLDRENIARIVEDVVAMAKLAPEDPHAGLALPSSLSISHHDDLDLYDDTKPSAEDLRLLAWKAEKAALSQQGITNSEGGAASSSHATRHHYATNGLKSFSQYSSFSLSASVLAGHGTSMERDYDYDVKRHWKDLNDPDSIGLEAAQRATARLGSIKPPSGKLPVIFAPRVARSLIGHFLQAISGDSVARGSTFLRESMGTKIMPDHCIITDDPTLSRAMGSQRIDGEGLASEPLTLVENGILQHWLLDLSSARQLGLSSNGRAGHTLASPPSPSSTNIEVTGGVRTMEEMITDLSEGLFVTELIGMGVNGVTGDYSRGASGFMIRQGALAEPVSELTIAGTLQEIFANLEASTDRDGHGPIAVGAIHAGILAIAGA